MTKTSPFTAAPGGAPRASMPGLGYVDDVLHSYRRGWERHRQAMDSAYGQVSSEATNVNSWTSAATTLFGSFSESLRDVYGAWMGGLWSSFGPAAGAPAPAAPVLFLVDQAAEAAGDAQFVPLPSGIEPASIRATPLVRGDGEELAPHHLHVTTENGRLRLHVGDFAGLKPSQRKGRYDAVVYSQGHGSPTPLAQLALVFVAD